MRAYSYYESPIGKLRITEVDGAITQLVLASLNRPLHGEYKEEETALIVEVKKQLGEYFAKTRTDFDFKMQPKGTDFQKEAWQALVDIPYGETRSYKQIAEAIQRPKASRAVGLANNKNQIIIAIPCHRVIGSNGALVGYAGGLHIKEALLKIEGVL